MNDVSELAMALSCGAKIIGVNNRDLSTFNVDLGTTETIANHLKSMPSPPDVAIVALSGIKNRADVERMATTGASGVLVGESLMRSSSPETLIHELLGTSKPSPSPGSHPRSPFVKV